MTNDPDLTDQIKTLIDASFRLLSFRPRSEREIRDYAKRKDFPDQAADAAIFRLKELKYLDDFEFSTWWITSRSGRRAKGDRIITAELLAKGIPRDTITQALDSFRKDPGSGESDIARRALESKLRKMGSMEPRKLENYLYGYLIRRGFSPETVRGLIDEFRRKDYNTSQDDGTSEDD